MAVFQSGFVPALVNNLLIMGDVLSLLTPEQEVIVRDNLGGSRLCRSLLRVR